MASYEDLARGLMSSPSATGEEERVRVCYEKIYPLMLNDFAHKKDIERYVEAVMALAFKQMAATSPLLASLGHLGSSQVSLGDLVGKGLVIQKNSRLSDGSMAGLPTRRSLEGSGFLSRIKIDS